MSVTWVVPPGFALVWLLTQRCRAGLSWFVPSGLDVARRRLGSSATSDIPGYAARIKNRCDDCHCKLADFLCKVISPLNLLPFPPLLTSNVYLRHDRRHPRHPCRPAGRV